MLPQRDGRRGLLLRASRQLIGSSRRGVFGGGIGEGTGSCGLSRKVGEEKEGRRGSLTESFGLPVQIAGLQV